MYDLEGHYQTVPSMYKYIQYRYGNLLFIFIDVTTLLALPDDPLLSFSLVDLNCTLTDDGTLVHNDAQFYR